MPWIKDENGERKYSLSVYAKEELPTWGEMYEFIKNDTFFYDPEDDNHNMKDLYWKVPRQLYLISIVCNQLNKMLFEDGWKEKLLLFLKENYTINEDIVDIRFMLGDNKEKEYILKYYDRLALHNKDNASPITSIFTIPLPSGDKNPFICNNIDRIDISELTEKYRGSTKPLTLSIYTLLKDHEGSYYSKLIYSKYGINKKIFNFMFTPYIEYFNAPVGWKNLPPRTVNKYHIGIDLIPTCR